MQPTPHPTRSKTDTRRARLPWLPAGVIVFVFGLAILLVTQGIRDDIRAQIISRDADVLHATVMLQFRQLAEQLGDDVREPATLALVLLESTELRGVVAARLFETNGAIHTSWPIHVTDGKVDPGDLLAVLRSQPVPRFHPARRHDEVFLELPGEMPPDTTFPLLEVCVPMQAAPDAEVAGVAQFLLEGAGIAREFAALDRNLFARGAGVFIAGAVLILALMRWALVHLQRANDRLADRTRDLLRANEELALAARTSAVGSVAAHLIHGLKSPLSGLHQFVNGKQQRADAATTDPSMWEAAAASTRRMQQMVGEVVRVLREEQNGEAYELDLADIEELIRQRVSPLARETGVNFQISRNVTAELDNRQANLLVLILSNLIHNALQATPAGGLVTLVIGDHRAGLEFRVVDQGTGVPDAVRERLFTPCNSAREGGTGIGLVISRQLANHLGARLELESTSSRGSVFVLRLPLAIHPGPFPGSTAKASRA